MLSHCCKAGYHVCTPLNPNVRNRQHVCSAARLSPLGTGVPGGILSSPGTGLQLGTGAVPRADAPGSCEHFWPIELCYEHFWPTKPRDIPEIVGRKRTELTRDTATRPLRPTPRDRGLSPERTLWPLPREGTLASPAPVPREAKVARGTPVPREDIWRGQARKTEYANDPVLPICKGGVDIVS